MDPNDVRSPLSIEEMADRGFASVNIPMVEVMVKYQPTPDYQYRMREKERKNPAIAYALQKDDDPTKKELADKLNPGNIEQEDNFKPTEKTIADKLREREPFSFSGYGKSGVLFNYSGSAYNLEDVNGKGGNGWLYDEGQSEYSSDFKRRKKKSNRETNSREYDPLAANDEEERQDGTLPGVVKAVLYDFQNSKPGYMGITIAGYEVLPNTGSINSGSPANQNYEPIESLGHETPQSNIIEFPKQPPRQNNQTPTAGSIDDILKAA